MVKYKFNDDIWIRYLIKKGIIRKGLRNYEESESEMKEFKSMLYRLLNSQTKPTK